MKTEYHGSVYIGKVYTDGPKEGQVEEAEINNTSITPSSVEAAESGEITPMSLQTASLPSVVEKTTEIEKMTGTCGSVPKRCDRHYLNMKSVKLTDPADALGKGLFTTVISQLITLSRSSYAKVLGGYAGTVAGALLAFGTSTEYTFGIMDIDTYGGTWPKAITAGSKTYAADSKSELTHIRGPTIHQGHWCEDPDNRV